MVAKLTERIIIELPASMKRQIEAEAKQRRGTQSDVVREAINEHLARREAEHGTAN